MAEKIKSIPKGYHSINPDLVVSNGAKAIDFYKNAFNAQEIYRKMAPNGKLMHAALKIGDSVLMLADECPDHPGHETDCVRAPSSIKGTSVNLFLYVDNVDKVFQEAVSFGARSIKPVENMFWGDRMGMLIDPFGHFWSVATHIEDPSPEEIDKRAEEMFKAKV